MNPNNGEIYFWLGWAAIGLAILLIYLLIKKEKHGIQNKKKDAE